MIAHEVSKILRAAEERLQQLIQQGLAEQRYGEVARLATVAEELAQLARRTSSDWLEESSDGQVGSSSSRTGGKPRREHGEKRRGEYPRFERETDKLIKIGWSKKNRDVYEHRAPKAVVLNFARHLAAHVRPGTLFTMEELLPLPDGDDGETPSYQVYMALAWLRDSGAIERQARDGYTYAEGAIGERALQELWTTVPERRH